MKQTHTGREQHSEASYLKGHDSFVKVWMKYSKLEHNHRFREKLVSDIKKLWHTSECWDHGQLPGKTGVSQTDSKKNKIRTVLLTVK